MASTVPQATIFDKLLFIPHLFKVLAAVIYCAAAFPFLEKKPKKPFKYFVLAALRQNLDSISVAQEQWTIASSTQDVYLEFAKTQKFQPVTTQLNSGLRLHWLGPKTSEKIILYFHGGGYVLPCSDGHLKWLSDVQQEVSKTKSISIVLVAYTLAPNSTYPQQLHQAAEALNWLLGKRGTKPSDIVLGGDSAGGNLTLGLLFHLLHPHPEVNRIELSQPLASGILISPWITFSTSDESFKHNARIDMLPPAALRRWGSLFLDGKKPDAYCEPAVAETDWLHGLDRVVKSVLVWGGSSEVLIDSIQKFGKALKDSHPTVEVVIQDGAMHDDVIIDAILGYTEKHQATTLIESWLAQRA